MKKNFKTQILTQIQLLQILNTQIVKKLKNSICFSKNNLTPPKPMRFLRAAFRDLAMFFKQQQQKPTPEFGTNCGKAKRAAWKNYQTFLTA